MSEAKPFYNFEAIIPKLRDLIGHGLVGGMGQPEPGKLCVEAAVCLVLGLPHSDTATDCVGAPDRRFAIRLNDARWSSDQARAEGMSEFAVAHLGSAKMTAKQRKVWRGHIVEQTIRRIVPMALRTKRATPEMLAAADRCEREGTREAVQAARSVARAAYAAYAAAAYAAAAYDAAYAADAAAADAAYAAAYAAADAAAYAAADAAADKVLCESARIAVEAYALAREA